MKDIHAFEPIWEDWVIDDEIGHGSFGTVWKAHHEDRFSHVRQYAAVKHISIPKQDGPGDDIDFPSDEVRAEYYRNMLNRLIVEIDAMISLRGKPNIVFCEEHKVVPKEQDSGYDLFLRMELLKSVPKYLSENKKRFPDHDETLRLGIDIATALETLESRNFVHRDIKPDNIFTDEEGNYKLGDFGTARVLEATGNASTITGTPNYMAPEVYSRSGHYDQTVDIYSLGIVLYRYLNNGSLPFMTDPKVFADDALTRRIRGEKLPNPCGADEELSAIILKACAFRPEDRYQNAKDLKRDLIRCLERPSREVEIPVVCQTDDGREIYRGIKKAKAGSRVRIGMEDIPYERLMGEGKDLVSAREIIVAVDAAGKASPPEARFIWSDSRTLFSVSVDVVCLDEDRSELLKQRTECYYQNRNTVKAPVIEGYKPVGRTEAEVEVLANRSTNPKQVVFEYRKEKAEVPAPAAVVPAECDVPVLCVLENGKVILNSKRTCRENLANIVAAPDITGYVLTGSGSEKVSVSHDGKANPEKVVFTYRTVKKGIVPAKVAVICRDDFGNELQRDHVEGKANETLNIKAPAIKGYNLVNTDNKAVELVVDENGIPSRNEVVFVYEKAKGSKLKLAIIGIAAALLLTGLAVLLIPRPKTVTYEVTWKNYNGDVLEQDLKVASGAMPEYNSETPEREDDNQYTYEFIGWLPETGPVKEDVSYTAQYKSTRKEAPNTSKGTDIPAEVTETPEPAVTPVPSYTITWLTGSGTETTTAAAGEMPEHEDPVKEPDEQYTYTFTGWTPEVKKAESDAVYQAVFSPEIRSYTITWVNEDGKELEKDLKVASGTMPEYNSSIPTKADDDRYSYSFSGWTPALETARKDTTYTAKYDMKEKETATPVPEVTPVPQYTITWFTGSGTETTTVAAGEMPSHADPVKEADEQYTYTFTGWIPEVKEAASDAAYIAEFREETRSYQITWQDDTGKEIGTTTVKYGEKPAHDDLIKAATEKYTYTFTGWEPEIKEASGDATYTAIFKEELRTYTITWKDSTGKTIDTTTVQYGEKPTHDDLSKAATKEYTYTFAGWEPAIQNVTGDAAYTASFNQETRAYKITWQDDTGKTIDTTTVKYGDKPTHADIAKAATKEYTYTFAGWEPAIQEATEDATYKATFKANDRLYTITWQDDTGKTINTTNVAYGDRPTHADHTKASDNKYNYIFSGWKPAVTKVTGDATYTAVFYKSLRSYTITWKNETGGIINTSTVLYGFKPTHTAPTKASDKQYTYTFAGWTPKITTVTADATYTATFKQETRSYKITWKDDTGKTIDTTTVKYGKKPSHKDLTKASDKQYTYTFTGWKPKIAKVTGDATYTAVFKKKKRIIQAGDIVSFGHYEQDNNKSNGAEKIEWLVLDVQGNNALLISCYALDVIQYYNNGCVNITWGKCSLRKWLNNDFYKKAFSKEEQKAIAITNVDNSNKQHEIYDTNLKRNIGGNNTKDRLYVLSYAEAMTYFFGNNAKFNSSCQPTVYASRKLYDNEVKTVEHYGDSDWPYTDEKSITEYIRANYQWANWWLRSPLEPFDNKSYNNYVKGVYYNSNYKKYMIGDFNIAEEMICVRPVLWLNINAYSFK